MKENLKIGHFTVSFVDLEIPVSGLPIRVIRTYDSRDKREGDFGFGWRLDLWTYDFRRTEMCVIPYATQEGEISFCAYNTGVGWRKIVENMHMVARTRDWFQEMGRHRIYAGDRLMPLGPAAVTLPVVQPSKAKLREPAHAGTAQLQSSCGCGS